MVQPFMPSARGWLSGTGLKAKWDYNTPSALVWNPQYLINYETALKRLRTRSAKIGYREVARSTDPRSFIGALLPQFPSGHKVPVLGTNEDESSADDIACAQALLNSFVFDWLVRQRLGGAALTWSLLKEAVLPVEGGNLFRTLSFLTDRLNLFSRVLAPLRIRSNHRTDLADALSPAERLRLRVMVDVVSASVFGLDIAALRHVLNNTDLPTDRIATRSSSVNNLDARGFWRVDRDKPPELRHTVLTQVAFADLQRHINSATDNHEAGIRSFMAQNEGEGWLLPETLRLADYDLGHDDRATEHQPVATELGPRFYAWQLAQPPEEASAETHLHARHLLGEHGYRRLLAELEQDPAEHPPSTTGQPLSEVAEERHRWDQWLDGATEDPNPRERPDTDQTDLFK